MPAPANSLKQRLSETNEITITVAGRRSGREISLPVWFVLEGNDLYLLPVRGADTQWYRNALRRQVIRIRARGAEREFQVIPITQEEQVASVAEKFRRKYGPGEVEKYYSNFNAAILVPTDE